MRFLDLGVAAMIGLGAIGFIIQWSPTPYVYAAKQSRADAALHAELAGLVESWGLNRLEATNFAQICTSLSALSNSTVTVSGTIDGEQCPCTCPPGQPTAVLDVPLPNKELTVEAWRDGVA